MNALELASRHFVKPDYKPFTARSLWQSYQQQRDNLTGYLEKSKKH